MFREQQILDEDGIVFRLHEGEATRLFLSVTSPGNGRVLRLHVSDDIQKFLFFLLVSAIHRLQICVHNC